MISLVVESWKCLKLFKSAGILHKLMLDTEQHTSSKQSPHHSINFPEKSTHQPLKGQVLTQQVLCSTPLIFITPLFPEQPTLNFLTSDFSACHHRCKTSSSFTSGAEWSKKKMISCWGKISDVEKSPEHPLKRGFSLPSFLRLRDAVMAREWEREAR